MQGKNEGEINYEVARNEASEAITHNTWDLIYTYLCMVLRASRCFVGERIKIIMAVIKHNEQSNNLRDKTEKKHKWATRTV